MSILVLDLFATAADLADELRRHTTDDVSLQDALGLLAGRSQPAADVTIVVVSPPGVGAAHAVDDAGVSHAVGVAAWEKAARTALAQARRGRRVAIVDAASPGATSKIIAEACGLDRGVFFAPRLSTRDTPKDDHPLYTCLRNMVGIHTAMPDVTLPPVAPNLDVLIEEFLTAHDLRQREYAVLHRALSAVDGLLPRRRAVLRGPDPYAARFGLNAAEDVTGYRAWLQNHRSRQQHEHDVLLSELMAQVTRPKLSVVVPVYRPDLDLFGKCVESVMTQSYPSWELCLCDDKSDDTALDAEFEELEQHPQVRVTRRATNGGISAATNDAARLATGEFVVFLDQDDELAEGALARVAKAAVDNPEADVIYTDEDKLDVDGQRMEPHFKPDWSPDLLLSQMYIGHLLVIRRQLLESLGGLRSEYDGSQDFDLALRATERARDVVHIPRVAYHWRRLEGSSALDYRAKPYADVAARAAITDALRRRGEDALVEDGLCEGTFRVRRAIPHSPLVSIIIPFRDGATLLRKCVDSLYATAGYDNWEAILVDNRSWEPETLALTQQLSGDPKVRLMEYDHDFNYSAINNWAAEQAAGDLLLFLNSDVEGHRQGWLAALVEHAQRPEVGLVGARLLYPHGTVQHAGVVLGMGGGVAWHAFCHAPQDAPGYFAQAKVIRNYSALTAACVMVRRGVFEAVGGFDESLAVGFNDVELCLQVRERGLRLVYTPFAELTHYESATRGRGQFEARETIVLFQRWGHLIRNDPYFNPNLDIRRSDFGIAPGAEEVDRWRHVLSLAERSSSSSGRRSV